MRIRCKAFGCLYDEYCSCARCGEDIYSGMFIQIAWLEPLYRLKWKWKQNRWRNKHKCEVCGRSMFFTDEHCCSEKCYSEWCPF